MRSSCAEAIEHLRKGVLQSHAMNVGTLAAGKSVGAVPDQARAGLRVLFGGDASWRTLYGAVSGALETYVRNLPAAKSGYTVAVTPSGLCCNPGASPWDGKQCVTLRESIAAIAGRAPSSYPNHYGGDIRFPLRLMGVPAFGIGSRGGSFYGERMGGFDDLVLW